MTTGELTWLRGEVTVYRVTRLLVGEVLHGLKRRRSCGKRKATVVVKKNKLFLQPQHPTFMTHYSFKQTHALHL